MKQKFVFSSLLWHIFKKNGFLNEKKCGTELDFVLQELFGSLSFANCCDLIMSEGIYFNKKSNG